MSHSGRFGSTLVASFVALAVMVAAESRAQHSNPYRRLLPLGKTSGGEESEGGGRICRIPMANTCG